jgi:hypothetical protein
MFRITLRSTRNNTWATALGKMQKQTTHRAGNYTYGSFLFVSLIGLLTRWVFINSHFATKPAIVFRNNSKQETTTTEQAHKRQCLEAELLGDTVDSNTISPLSVFSFLLFLACFTVVFGC